LIRITQQLGLKNFKIQIQFRLTVAVFRGGEVGAHPAPLDFFCKSFFKLNYTKCLNCFNYGGGNLLKIAPPLP